jgi:hypothetical protein
MAVRSEFLGIQHRHHQVDEAGESDESDDDVLHERKGWTRRASSAELFAAVDVGDGDGEKGQ